MHLKPSPLTACFFNSIHLTDKLPPNSQILALMTLHLLEKQFPALVLHVYYLSYFILWYY